MLITLLIAGEVVARVVLGLGEPPLYQPDSEMEYLLKPDQQVTRFGHRYAVNHYSMRSENFPLERGPHERRILVFGDSVINGGAQVDQAHIATELLRATLAKRNDAVTVGNVSAFSWGPGNWLAYAKRFGFFEADTIIIVTNSGDYGDAPTFEPLNPLTHPTSRPLSAMWEGAVKYLPEYAETLWPTAIATTTPRTAREREESLRDLKALLVMAKATGARVALVEHYQTPELEAKQIPEGLRVFADACAELDVPVVSLRDMEARAGNAAYLDHIHLSEEGQRALAGGLLQAAGQ